MVSWCGVSVWCVKASVELLHCTMFRSYYMWSARQPAPDYSPFSLFFFLLLLLFKTKNSFSSFVHFSTTKMNVIFFKCNIFTKDLHVLLRFITSYFVTLIDSDIFFLLSFRRTNARASFFLFYFVLPHSFNFLSFFFYSFCSCFTHIYIRFAVQIIM